MRKDQMTPHQLRERELIVSTLTEAGWKGSASNRLFEQGKPAKLAQECFIKTRT